MKQNLVMKSHPGLETEKISTSIIEEKKTSPPLVFFIDRTKTTPKHKKGERERESLPSSCHNHK
jgi:hypothetical protein